MKNFHLPLPDKTYELLRAEAERSQVPATAAAREAIDMWLKEQRKKTLHVEIAAYAAEMAGTEFDLDPQLEATTIEHLTRPARKRRK